MPESDGGVYDAVLVCAGATCPHAEETLELLGEVVRCTGSALLVRTECHRRCDVRLSERPSIVLRRSDAELRPVVRDTPLAVTGSLVGLRRQVATWLMTVRPAPAD